VRKNQAALNERQWDNLVFAMKSLKKSDASRNWDYFAETHNHYGSLDGDGAHDHDLPHVDGVDLTIHDAFYWLAWHRKFILEFESELQGDGLSGDLPYWDWTTTRDIPEALHAKVGGWMNVSRAVFHDSDKLPTASDLRNVTGQSSYSSFDYGLRQLHAIVHNWIGGSMANPATSAKDPLFFLHHAFLDKVWSQWQDDHPTQHFADEYLDGAIPPWDRLLVRDVMHIRELKYRYT